MVSLGKETGLELVLDLGFEAASSIACWMGDLFIGTPSVILIRQKKKKDTT